MKLGSRPLLGLALLLAGFSAGQGQMPPETPVKELIRKMSRGADVTTPERQRAAALRFELALERADPSDPWWTKAHYDLGYDLANVGEYKRAVKAFEKVVASRDSRFPGLQSAAAGQIAQALEADGATPVVKERAYRRAIKMVNPRDSLAPQLRMTQRAALIDAIAEGKGKGDGDRAFEEWKAFVAEGKRGQFAPAPNGRKVDGFHKDSWKENAEILLRNLADGAATRGDVASATKAFALYRREHFGGNADIAFAAAIKHAEQGEDLSLATLQALLSEYPTPSPARAGILADSLVAAMGVDDCKTIKKNAAELLAMTPVKEDQESPERFHSLAKQALKGCGEEVKTEVAEVIGNKEDRSVGPVAIGAMAALSLGAFVGLGINFRGRLRRKPMPTALS